MIISTGIKFCNRIFHRPISSLLPVIKIACDLGFEHHSPSVNYSQQQRFLYWNQGSILIGIISYTSLY